MIVVDANIMVALLAPGDDSPRISRLLALDPDWIAPPLLRSEFRNALATMIRRRILEPEIAFQLMEEAEEILEGNEIPVRSLDVLALSQQSGCSAYDCEYVALAQAFRISLLTWDQKILAAFPETAFPPERLTGV